MPNTFVVILIVLAMVATVVMLIRGIVIFLKTTEADLNAGPAGPSASSTQQNKMMQGRIFFQAVAVVLVAILLLLARR
jgi:hypothetical protein